MSKRGQITIFIIIGILMLGATALAFYSQEISSFFAPEFPVDSEINQYVTSCLQGTADEALAIIGKNGGYLYPSDQTLAYSENRKLVLEYKDHKTALPQAADIEARLERYLNDNFEYCLNDFSAYKQRGIVVNAGKPQIKATVGTDSVQFNVDYDVAFTKGNRKTEIKSFSYISNFALGKALSLSEGIISQVHKTQLEIDGLKKLKKVGTSDVEVIYKNPKDEYKTDKFTIYPHVSDDFATQLWVLKQDNHEFQFATELII